MHVGVTEPGPQDEDVNMVSNSNFQCMQSSNSSNLQTFKLPNFENVKHSNSTSLKL